MNRVSHGIIDVYKQNHLQVSFIGEVHNLLGGGSQLYWRKNYFIGENHLLIGDNQILLAKDRKSVV